jgi:hypothetical protein
MSPSAPAYSAITTAVPIRRLSSPAPTRRHNTRTMPFTRADWKNHRGGQFVYVGRGSGAEPVPEEDALPRCHLANRAASPAFSMRT